MNVYIVFSYRDRDKVRSYLEALEKNSSFNPIIANGGNCWKLKARKHIRRCAFVIFFCGTESCNSKSIGWEIQKAIEYERCIYRIDLTEGVESHQALTIVEEFTNKETQYENA